MAALEAAAVMAAAAARRHPGGAPPRPLSPHLRACIARSVAM